MQVTKWQLRNPQGRFISHSGLLSGVKLRVRNWLLLLSLSKKRPLGKPMDEAIKKVKKSVDKKLSHLVKLDVPRDKKLKKCDKMMKKKKKK